MYKNGYEVKKIMQDTAYYVPWMSLINNQTAVIRDSIINISSQMKKDVNGYIEFKPSNSSILVNSSTNFRTYYSSINNTNILPTRAFEWNSNESLKTIGSVYAVTNTGDTIGKLNVSCSKTEKKKIEFIYVDIGTGYDSSVLSRIRMINYLDSNSHNQFFRKWELVNLYTDTLNLRSEFISNPQNFSYDSVDVINRILKNYYKQKYGVDMSNINQMLNNGTSLGNQWIRFAFVLPREYRKDSIGPSGQIIPLGWTNGAFGTTYGGFYKTASLRTVVHELGHGLNNQHIFPETDDYGVYHPNFLIPKFSTRNFMDYFVQGGTTANMFFYAQWILTF